MPNLPILSFNSGELSPLIDARTDTEKYSSGCRHLDNFYPRIYGSAERRQGTKYVVNQYSSTGTYIRNIPFVYSSEVSYGLEFGNLYIRPFSSISFEGDIVLFEGNEVIDVLDIITSPYLTADIPQIQYKQLGDTMWLMHRDYAQRKLIRTSPSSFELNEIEYKKGPFILRKDIIKPTVTAYMILGQVTIEYNPTINAESNMYGSTWFAQTFTPDVNFDLYGVALRLWKVGSGFGDTSIRILDTTLQASPSVFNFCPELSGTPISSIEIISESDITETSRATSAFHTVTFDSVLHLTAGTTYAIVASTAAGDNTSNNVKVTYNSSATGLETATYNALFSINAGVSSWTATGISILNHHIVGVATSSGGSSSFNGTMSCVQSDGTTPVNYFESGHAGSLFKLTFPRATKVSTDRYSSGDAIPFTICPAIDIKGSMRFEAKGHLKSATVELQRNENGAGWETVEVWEVLADINTTFTKVEDADNVQYRAVVTAINFTFADPYLRASITCSNSTQDCVVRAETINSNSQASVSIISGTPIISVTRRWAEGAWSPLRGYPVSMAFFEDRCCFTAMQDIQTQVLYDNTPPHTEPSLPKGWPSHTGDYENFEVGVKDADSFEVTIPSANDVQWIESLEALVVGTNGDEWRIGSNKMQQPITPTNYSVRQQSAYGNKSIQPMIINDQLLFVDSVGRKLRESAYDGDKYRAIDLTTMAEHITVSGIVDTAYQRNPDSIIWCVLDNGNLVAMVYEKYEKVIAWFNVPIDGKVQSVCVATGIGEDDVWLSVKRNIAGTDNIFIEKLSPRKFNYIEDAFYVDCGFTYTLSDVVTSAGEDVLYEGRIVMIGPTFHTVSGLSHLNGETVSVLADGEPYTDIAVAGGSITLPTGVYPQKVQIGLPYTSKLQPMRIVTGSASGSSQGTITRVPKMSVSFLNAMDAQYGASSNALFDINWDDPKWENSEDTMTGTFTGEVEVTVDGGFSVQNPIIISTDAPLPCVVRSIMPRLEVTGS
jgi:hypothetical protein